MAGLRIGRQTPTSQVIIPFDKSKGNEVAYIYSKTTKQLHEWQKYLIEAIMGQNSQGLWTHTKFGYEVSRRNGKGEILIARELWGLINGEKILHTAHQTPTSHSAWERLCSALDEIGIPYHSNKQYGLEVIKIAKTGGNIQFRTRTSKSALGEGYDLLVIDEAQEYTIDQETAIKYTVTASKNPQTILCGTPPTATSAGTVFMKMRDRVLRGHGQNDGWAEWSVDHLTDPNDTEAWYETNPNLNQGLTERNIRDEITENEIDFNIQRLGLWLRYSQKSAIGANEWEQLKIKEKPKFNSGLYVGIKYSKDNTVALSIAVKTKDKKVFIEGIDCQDMREGNDWIIRFLQRAQVEKIAIDGAGAQTILTEELKANGIKNFIMPTVKEVIHAGATLEKGIFQKEICHNDQPSMTASFTNCEKRAIGSNGGFGFKSIKEGVDVALLDSAMFGYWLAKTTKEKSKAKVYY